MSTRRAALVAMSLVALAASGARQQPVVRERRRVVVGADTEEWRLEWTSRPHWVCTGEDDALARPCSGWTFGESGPLVLVRRRANGVEERLSLDRFFGETPDGLRVGVLRRWPTWPNDFDSRCDDSAAVEKALRRPIRTRPVVTVMCLGDYDRDGRATEFVLEIDPYRRGSVLVGMTTHNPRLHLFGTALHPDSELVLGPNQWDALLRSPDGHVVTLNLSCGDHGSDEEQKMELRTSPEGIHATLYTYACDEHFNHTGILKSKEEF